MNIYRFPSSKEKKNPIFFILAYTFFNKKIVKITNLKMWSSEKKNHDQPTFNVWGQIDYSISLYCKI